MDAYAESVGFSDSGPSQIWTYIPKTNSETMEKEIKTMDLKWGEVEMATLDKIGWRQRVNALCFVLS